MKKVVLKDILQFKKSLTVLSGTVVRPAFGDGTVCLWVDHGLLYVYAEGRDSSGYISTPVESENWPKTKFSVLQTFLGKATAMLHEDEEAFLELDEENFLIRLCGGGLRFSLRGSHGSFTKISLGTLLWEFRATPSLLQDICKKVAVCSAKGTAAVSPSFEAIGVISDGSKMSFWGTNSHVLGNVTVPIQNGAKEQVAEQVAASSSIWNLGAAISEPVRIKVYRNVIVVSGDDFSFMFNNYNATLPSYDRVTAPLEQYLTSVRIPKAPFAEGLKAVRLVACVLDNAGMNLAFGKDCVTLSAADKEVGETKVRISVSCLPAALQGKKLCISSDYLMQAVSAVSGDTVELLFPSPEDERFALRPIKVLTGETSFMVICPMRQTAS